VHYSSRHDLHNLEHLEPAILDSVEIVKGDIGDPFSVDRAVIGCDSVFHLAALIGIPYSYVAPASYVVTNVHGTLNILEAARKHNVSRVIHTSTSETYGSSQYTPMDEKHPTVGQSPYSASKIGADKLAESFWLSFETPVTTVRPFNTFGPRQSMRAVIPTIIAQALSGKKLALGSTDPVRDFTYVSDTVAGFMAAERSEQAIGELINLGVGKGISIGDLVNTVGSLLGKKLEVASDAQRVRPAASEVSKLISDNSKARKLLDWSPEVSLTDGLQETIQFVQAHVESLRVADYVV
jgi:NAD dependent epimerase/dehydratase